MEYREDLIRYRISRAEGTIEEAELAIKNNKLSLAENRIYYSIFYIVSAACSFLLSIFAVLSRVVT